MQIEPAAVAKASQCKWLIEIIKLNVFEIVEK